MEIADLKLKVNNGNLIPHYQQKHKLYDRFLPFFAKYLNGRIVDIGSNCGLLLAAMLANNPELKFLCCEMEQKVYDILEHNKGELLNVFPKAQIDTFRGKIGRVGVPMDTLFTHELLNDTSLIKTDTDGFDWDILRSFSYKITPLIYFEADYRNQEQYTQFIQIPEFLMTKGYTAFYLFDNFGEFVCKTNNVHQIRQMMDYIWRMKRGHSDITMWYFDILATTPMQESICNQAVYDYCEWFT